MKTQDERNQTISIKVSREDYKILQQIKVDRDIPSMAKVIHGLILDSDVERQELKAKLLKIVEDNHDKPENLETILRVVESALDKKEW